MSDILNNALNLKIADSQVSAAYLNDVRVWPPGVGLWAFNIPPNGSELQLQLRSNDGSDIQLNWGDTTTDDILTSNAITSHIYNFDNDFSTWTGAVSVSQPEKITVYNARNTSGGGWTVGQQFFGKTDISVLPNLQFFHIQDHSTEVVGFESLTNVLAFRNVGNDSTGKLLEDISNKPALNVYNIISTNYKGPVHSPLPNPNFLRYVVSNNKLTGTLPDFDNSFNCSNIQYYWVNNNNITGTLPSLEIMSSNYTNSNTDTRQMVQLDFSNNSLDGLRDINNWTVNDRIIRLNLSNNNLPSSALDKIIIEMDLYGAGSAVGGNQKFLYLNRNPGTVSQSVINTNVASLRSKGWTVTHP